MNLFIAGLLLALLTEATTNIISKSALFVPVKEFFFTRISHRGCKFIHDLLDCPYCTSVWIGGFYVFVFYLFIHNLLPSIFLWFFAALVLHRLSNIVHHLIDRVDGADYMDFDPEKDKEND